jgi:hypothetical protein
VLGLHLRHALHGQLAEVLRPFERFSSSMTSMLASAAAQAIGLPP